MPSIHAIVSFLLVCVISLVVSAPLATRDVFVPPVTYPHSGVVWYTGDHHNVTWDTSNPPAQITNRQGSVILAKNGRLFLDNYLAKGFDILDGRVEIIVPDVDAGDDYSVVVMGDSGNYGETFTIKHKA